MKAALRTISSALTAATALSLLAACGAPSGSAEEQIRAWLDGVETAAENRDRRGVLDHISHAYADGRGNSRDDISDMLRLYFLRHDGFELITRIESIDVHGGTAANVALTVAMAGRSDNLLGIGADAVAFHLELSREGDDWRLISARWGEPGGPLD